VDPRELNSLLQDVRQGRLTPEAAAERLKSLPFEDLGFAKLDHHRSLRRGFGEVVYGAGKADEHLVAIVERIVARGQNVLVTRTRAHVHAALTDRGIPSLFHSAGSCISVVTTPVEPLPGRVALVCAGTSDVPVAEEAALTAEFHGAAVDRIYDVGVAGLHRLLDNTALIRRASVVVVVAGMEGALPSVVGGLVEAPVIAVPTSIGYGAAFQGLAALLAMLNSCASGIAVVNIDNGFGAGYMACSILKTALRREE
jgi:pyridinium-3,5-biscarboxylic acid mononucleotide synthase